MAQPEEARDPSMEEILVSIRRIIAEDGVEPNTPPHLSVVSEPEDATAGDDVIAVEADGAGSGGLKVDDIADEPVDASADRPVDEEAAGVSIGSSSTLSAPDSAPVSTDDADQAGDQDSDNTEPDPATTAFETIESEEADNRLLSPQADHAVHGAFDQLASTILSDQARTLEDLVRDMMRPMLQHWLDDNLPVLVERLVREEIERVSRGRR
jgi:cell pole-organizing protein PopZ